ncbi:hypothetical protein [Parasedimentitalea maritima]|uniref:hypothetical protein n=1 Tax=Parasedimentitalea maritima TaxID=2578117 RepID=UPI00148518A6|nr:hypothetical protein [Zongyanglinia marina]
MRNSDRERKTQRLFYALILGLLVAYAGLKYRHISLAFTAYEGQVLKSNTSGAAK